MTMPTATETSATSRKAQPKKQVLNENIANLLENAKKFASAAEELIARSDDAQRDAVEAVYKLYHEIVDDEPAFKMILEQQGIKPTKPLLQKPALALIKSLFKELEPTKASLLSRVINALHEKEVEPDEAAQFISENKGLVEVSKLYKAKGGQSEAAKRAFKRACRDAREKELGTVANIEASGSEEAGGFVLLLGRPKGDGSLAVTGVVNEEKMVKSAVRMVAKKAFDEDKG
jgi:hypothetical protein